MLCIKTWDPFLRRNGKGLVKLSTRQLGGPEPELRIFPTIHKSECGLAVCLVPWACISLKPCPRLEFTREVGLGSPSSSWGCPSTPGIQEHPSTRPLIWEKHPTFKGQIFKNKKNAAPFTLDNTFLLVCFNEKLQGEDDSPST